MPAAPTSTHLPRRRFAWWRALAPSNPTIDARERLRVLVGALLGVAGMAAMSRALMGGTISPWLVAPLGASTVLVFALPASPLAQPWAVVVGNTVSALAGIACVAVLPEGLPQWAAAPALAIGAMMACRALHPPGGAVALLMVLSGVHSWHFALLPVALNSLLLVGLAMLWNPLTGRRYPHPQQLSAKPPGNEAGQGFSDADLNAVLARYNQVLDLPRDDLRELLEQAEWQAHTRRLRALRCADVMTPSPLAVQFGTGLDEAWQLMRAQRVKALPVVDRYDHIVGIVTPADFLRLAGLGTREGLGERLRQRLMPSSGPRSDKPEVVGQIMSRQVRVASTDRPLADLLPLFATEGHHHIPVIGERNRLVGILTQTDVVAALLREAHREAGAAA